MILKLSSGYDPDLCEQGLYQWWEEQGYFKPSGVGKPYCIALPPPNITGTLHMGHCLQHTIMDCLIRYHRMCGYNTLWQPGLDHAGIATQLVVENWIIQNGDEIDTDEAFIAKLWQWKERFGNTIIDQMKRIGCSCDWSRSAFTMDDHFSSSVNDVFIKLYNSGYIYRDYKLVYWDKKRKTAVSDLEVRFVEESGFIWTIRYPLEGSSNQYVEIATTRPETMFGDSAIAVNQNDVRYQHLIGKTAIVPIVNRTILIIADDFVDPGFGTGCVKITPAHDFSDYEVGIRHNLAFFNILNESGMLNENVPSAYIGLSIMSARERLLEQLQNEQFLVETKVHRLSLPKAERDEVVLEPLLTTQWFCNMQDMAKDAVNIVKQDKTTFIPHNWSTTYFHWLDNIKPWCISRQISWGHKIPVYYDSDGKYYVANSFLDACKQAGHNQLTAETDVLDTWFSSALWCFVTLGWSSDDYLSHFLPTNILVTGFDIIFFWVARMIMLTSYTINQTPFREVLITGLIVDTNGQKMSKSKGNVIDPLDLIDGITVEQLVKKRTSNLLVNSDKDKIVQQTVKTYPNGFSKFGVDAVRFAFLSFSANNREIKFELSYLDNAHNFCNKLWNAARFIFLMVDKVDRNNLQLLDIDKWIFSKLNTLREKTIVNYNHYRFDLLSHDIYDFVWNDFCSWYLECAKVELVNKQSTVSVVLVMVLDSILRILHPLMPFITEYLWQCLRKVDSFCVEESIMIAPVPDYSNLAIQVPLIDKLQSICVAIRSLRVKLNISPSLKIPLVIYGNYNLTSIFRYLNTLAKINDCSVVDLDPDMSDIRIFVVDNIVFKLDVELSTLFDKNDLLLQISKINKELTVVSARLNNTVFLQKAPKAVISKDKDLLVSLKSKLEMLSLQIDALN